MRCKYCGCVLKKKDKECPNCKHLIENNDINYTKRNSNWVLIIIILLLLGVIVGGYFYVTKPEVMFNTLLNKVYKSANTELKNYKQTKTNIDMSFNVDAGEEYKDIVDIVNNFKIKSSFNVDSKNEKFALGLGAYYNNKAIIDADMYYEKDMAYLDLKDLFGKLIKFDINMKEEKIDITEKDINIIANNIFNALKEGIKKADYVVVKESKINKNTLVINNDNKDNVMNTIVDYLLNSNDFIDVIKKISSTTKEEVINSLKDLKNIEELKEEIHISIYTKVFTNEFIKLELGTKEEVVLTLTIPQNNVYKIESFDYEGSKFTITVTQDNDNKISVVSNIESTDIKMVVNMNISYVYNEEIQIPVTKASVLMDELTEEDTNSIMENLMQNEGIIEIVEAIQSLIPKDLETDTDFDVDGDFEVDIEFDEDFSYDAEF